MSIDHELKAAGGTPPTVCLLTPSGSGAIAVLAVAGPGAWSAVRSLFHPAGGRVLPSTPSPGSVWYGRFGPSAELADEVLLVAVDAEHVELHCHGGRQVVQWLIRLFEEQGCREVPALDDPLLAALARAPTLRTAGILLDQYHGAFAAAVERILTAGDEAAFAGLVRYAAVGRHLVEPWQVALAGPPNVGKSSLLNALAGYQRSIVSPIPGTTRDAVRATVALDGWPVELIDTAGLREAAGLEAEGIRQTQEVLRRADLILWVADASAAQAGLSARVPDDLPQTLAQQADMSAALIGPVPSTRVDLAELIARQGDTEAATLGSISATLPDMPEIFIWQKDTTKKLWRVWNKSDLVPQWVPPAGELAVSAVTAAGLGDLARGVIARLVPDVPPPGAAVPYTPELAEQVETAWRLWRRGDPAAARIILQDCLRSKS